jgi:hypothetical protein
MQNFLHQLKHIRILRPLHILHLLKSHSEWCLIGYKFEYKLFLTNKIVIPRATFFSIVGTSISAFNRTSRSSFLVSLGGSGTIEGPSSSLGGSAAPSWARRLDSLRLCFGNFKKLLWELSVPDDSSSGESWMALGGRWTFPRSSLSSSSPSTSADYKGGLSPESFPSEPELSCSRSGTFFA